MKTRRGIIGVFFSKFTILYKAKPRFWGKLTNCVADLAQNTCVSDCRLLLLQLTFSISSWQKFMNTCTSENSILVHQKRLMKPCRRITDIFLLQPHYIIHSQQICWSKVEHFSGYIYQNHNCIWSLILRIPIKDHYYFTRKAHKSWAGNQRQVFSPALPFSTKPISILEWNWHVLWLVWPKKTCVCVFRLTLYHLNFTVSSLSRFVKPGTGTITR